MVSTVDTLSPTSAYPNYAITCLQTISSCRRTKFIVRRVANISAGGSRRPKDYPHTCPNILDDGSTRTRIDTINSQAGSRPCLSLQLITPPPINSLVCARKPNCPPPSTPPIPSRMPGPGTTCHPLSTRNHLRGGWRPPRRTNARTTRMIQ